MIPGQVLDLIDQTPSIELPGEPTREHECQGAKFHSPRPMLVHPFKVDQRTVYLCGTCADNVQVLLALLTAHEGDVPWVVKRCFGNLVRSVAEAAFATAG